MKKKTKIIAALATCVCLILVAVLTLSLITVKPIDRMGEYNDKKILVLDDFGTAQKPNSQLVDEAFGTVKFSVMRAMLELSLGYNIKPVTYKNSDGDTVPVTYTASQFKAKKPAGGTFMIQLTYDTLQTNERFVDEDGKEIKYDTVIMMVPESGNKITTVRLYPFLEYNLTNENWDQDEYDDETGRIGVNYAKVYEFTAKMYTYKLHEKLSEEFTPGITVSVPDDVE